MGNKSKKPKIAIVEDEESLQRVLMEWFKLSGYDVVGITTGTEALEVIPKVLPDLILLDIILPEINGFEVMRKLSSDPTTSKIPIVVLTNLGDEPEKKQAFELGAREYLVKADYDFIIIEKIIKEILHR